ncbi:TIGR01459 family HAD-type hydrolase [Aestuariivirga sp.]|uniref:TIGR01459 family HAD-type hydrolase n=1 Tax=Aestuariivirga sp. TaxID=2650926 RepID=UPI0025C15A5A|nr:TIGR01459 family HAD-type hydrolase [Aestuariivirga sp.]MCA3556169.1 TIGR01459 family HAD-type hydrolase [Aestuariivirga sp.]
MPTDAKRINGLHEIASRFDGMLIDQFGVIHDGQTLYPDALRVLAGLKALGIPVAVMTNSGKRAEANRQRLVGMGVPRGHFVDAVSSGEVAFSGLTAKRAFLIGKDGEHYGFDGISFVSDPHEAEIILILGSNAPRTSLDDYRRLLAGMDLPAVCCNPDRLMLTPQGLVPAPGAIAALYEEMGRKVTWIGKPYAGIYRQAARLIGNPARILCIGDSALHDVAGGRNAGFATLLVLQGVSAGHDPATLSPQPDYVMDAFQW